MMVELASIDAAEIHDHVAVGEALLGLSLEIEIEGVSVSTTEDGVFAEAASQRVVTETAIERVTTAKSEPAHWRSHRRSAYLPPLPEPIRFSMFNKVSSPAPCVSC